MFVKAFAIKLKNGFHFGDYYVMILTRLAEETLPVAIPSLFANDKTALTV